MDLLRIYNGNQTFAMVVIRICYGNEASAMVFTKDLIREAGIGYGFAEGSLWEASFAYDSLGIYKGNQALAMVSYTLRVLYVRLRNGFSTACRCLPGNGSRRSWKLTLTPRTCLSGSEIYGGGLG